MTTTTTNYQSIQVSRSGNGRLVADYGRGETILLPVMDLRSAIHSLREEYPTRDITVSKELLGEL